MKTLIMILISSLFLTAFSCEDLSFSDKYDCCIQVYYIEDEYNNFVFDSSSISYIKKDSCISEPPYIYREMTNNSICAEFLQF